MACAIGNFWTWGECYDEYLDPIVDFVTESVGSVYDAIVGDEWKWDDDIGDSFWDPNAVGFSWDEVAGDFAGNTPDGKSYLDTVTEWGTSIGDTIQKIPKPMIQMGLTYLSNGSASDMDEAVRMAAEDFRKGVTDASNPKNVKSPLGNVAYDPETSTFDLTSSPEMERMRGDMEDQYAQVSKQLDPMLKDPEKARARIGQQMQQARAPEQQRMMNKAAGSLQASGMSGSSGGAEVMRGMVSGFAEQGAKDFLTADSMVNTNMQNYLTAQNNLLSNMISAGSVPADLANISTGAGSTMGAAAVDAGKPYMEAVTVGAVAKDKNTQTQIKNFNV